MKNWLIHNATIINEGKTFAGNVLIENEIIKEVFPKNSSIPQSLNSPNILDATGLCLLPGVIDDQVHFREPGLTHKGEICTESKAAVAGGVTTFMDMPNTVPPVLTQQLLGEKYRIASERSLANYSFYMGASNENLEEVLKTDPKNVCGVKVFMGSSTGNMLVDNHKTLESLFSKCTLLIAVHCEDEDTIRRNSDEFRKRFGENVPVEFHPQIRNEEACYKSSSFAFQLAKKHNTRLHIIHVSTAKEAQLFDTTTPLSQKRITSEVCVHHLWFSEDDYKKKGTFIKWNPSIKTKNDRDGLLNAILENRIDVIATDHSPHMIEEKQKPYFQCPSGAPMVQHSLIAMLELVHRKKITIEKVVEKMCHAPAECFSIEKRGYIREGYFADLVLVDLNSKWTVLGGGNSNLHYKCAWSPLERETFHSKVIHTFVNGHLAYTKDVFDETIKGKRLTFNR